MRQRLLVLSYWTRNLLIGARRYPVRTLLRTATVFALTAAAVLVVFPLYWLFSAAFRASEAISVPPSLLPSQVTLVNLVNVFVETEFPTYFVNSVLVSVATVALVVTIATPAGYALSRYDMRYARPLLLGILVVQTIPLLALVTPLYRIFALSGLLDTLTAIVLTDTVLAAPVGVWLIKQYFDTLPAHLEEAARVGGASRLRTFFVVLPLSRPVIASTAIYAFVVSWNQFIIPLTFASGPETWTFPVGLYAFISRRGVVNWSMLGAASLWAMIPLLLVVAVFHRRLVAGFSRGSLGGG